MQADSPSRQQCEQHNELLIKPTEESTSEPTATLNERIQELAQRSQELQERNDELEEEKHELEKEKNRFAKKAWNLEISLRNKRERLWGEMSGLQDALQAKKEEPQEALDSRADHRQAETVLREEFGSLRRRFREQDASLSQATTESNEKVREASEREGLLKETVKQLEKRLQDQNKLIRDQQASFSNVTAQSNERARDANVKQALLKENVEQLEQRLINQRRAFEEERAQWQQSAHTGQTEAQTELTSSLERAMPELRSLLSAYDRVHVNEKCLPLSAGKGQLNTTLKVIGKSHSDLTQRLKEQQRAFDQERAQTQKRQLHQLLRLKQMSIQRRLQHQQVARTAVDVTLEAHGTHGTENIEATEFKRDLRFPIAHRQQSVLLK
ncbi:hypothetical protein PI125_g16321 [Phytophthora idaei]|nr:hypothetical protein PI125_g16321 [Phytophthora idaei]